MSNGQGTNSQAMPFVKWARDKFTSNTTGQMGKGQKIHGGFCVSISVTLITVAGDSCPSNVTEWWTFTTTMAAGEAPVY